MTNLSRQPLKKNFWNYCKLWKKVTLHKKMKNYRTNYFRYTKREQSLNRNMIKGCWLKSLNWNNLMEQMDVYRLEPLLGHGGPKNLWFKISKVCRITWSKKIYCSSASPEVKWIERLSKAFLTSWKTLKTNDSIA